MIYTPPWTADLLTVGVDHSRPGERFSPKGVVVHSTADVGATALDIRDYFEEPKTTDQASAHLAVDWTEAVCMIPCLPPSQDGSSWCELAWHAGPTANSLFLGVEICETDDAEYFHATYLRTIAVLNYLAETWGWVYKDQDTIWSHNETSAMWHETDHVDPIPYFTKHGHTWAGFVADVLARRSS